MALIHAPGRWAWRPLWKPQADELTSSLPANSRCNRRINPLAWTLRALVANELGSPRWGVPSGLNDGLTSECTPSHVDGAA